MTPPGSANCLPQTCLLGWEADNSGAEVQRGTGCDGQIPAPAHGVASTISLSSLPGLGG